MRITKVLLFCMLWSIPSLVYSSNELIWTPANISGSGAFRKSIENGGIWFHRDFGWLNTDKQVWITHDAGRNWILSLTPPEDRYFYDSYFLNSIEGWVVAAHDKPLFHTKDGGISWEEMKVEIIQTSDKPVEPHFIVLVRVYFKDSLHGIGAFVIVNDELYPAWKDGIIARTQDGGKRWIEIDRGPLFPQLSGLDNHIWILNLAGSVSYTSDFGDTFRQISIPNLNPAHLAFISLMYGWAADGYRVLKTMDGGNTWSDPIFIQANRQSFIRGLCLISEDQGAVLVCSESENEGGSSLLYVTYNGGKSWISYQVPVRSECVIGCNSLRREIWLLPYSFREETAIYYASIDEVTAVRLSNRLLTTWALLKKARKEF